MSAYSRNGVPDFQYYSNTFAKTCKRCRGSKFIRIETGRDARCSCQGRAHAKYKYDRLLNEIGAEHLVKKTWKDFAGFRYDENDVAVEPVLSLSQAENVRSQAIDYCFGSTDLSLSEDRRANLQIKTRRDKGKNLIILGPEQSGRTFLGILVAKEIIYSSLYGDSYSVRWINFGEGLLSKCDLYRPDYNYADEIASPDFLFIDDIRLEATNVRRGLDKQAYVKTFYPRYNQHCLDRVFATRRKNHRPTILMGDEPIRLVTDSSNEEFFNVYGSEFSKLFKSQCTFINLTSEKV